LIYQYAACEIELILLKLAHDENVTCWSQIQGDRPLERRTKARTDNYAHDNSAPTRIERIHSLFPSI